MDEFSARNTELAAALAMENDSEANKLAIGSSNSPLNSPLHRPPIPYSPRSSHSGHNSTQTSPRNRSLSQHSTASNIMDHNGIFARPGAYPLSSSSLDLHASPEPRDVPLPTEEPSYEEQYQEDLDVPVLHQKLIDIEESVASMFSPERAPPFARAGRSLSISSHSSAAPSAPDPWQSANVTPAPLITPSILDLNEHDVTQDPLSAKSAAEPSIPQPKSRSASGERIHIPVEDMVRLELERIQLQGLQEAASEDILSKNSLSSSTIPHGPPPPFASTASIRSSSLSPLHPGKATQDSTSSLESIILAESQTWEKVEGLKDEWQELRNPREEVLAMSESESDLDEDDDEMWTRARAVDDLNEDKAFVPSVERRRKHQEHVAAAGTATPRAQRTPKPSLIASNSAVAAQPVLSHSAQPRNFFQHQPRTTAVVPVPQSKLTPAQEKLVAELQRNRSGRGIRNTHTQHTMRAVSPLFGDW